jgi:hypothetical protein
VTFDANETPPQSGRNGRILYRSTVGVIGAHQVTPKLSYNSLRRLAPPPGRASPGDLALKTPASLLPSCTDDMDCDYVATRRTFDAVRAVVLPAMAGSLGAMALLICAQIDLTKVLFPQFLSGSHDSTSSPASDGTLVFVPAPITYQLPDALSADTEVPSTRSLPTVSRSFQMRAHVRSANVIPHGEIRLPRQQHKVPVEHKPGLMIEKVSSIIERYAPKSRSPRVLAESIVREAKEQSFDPLFVAAVIKSESAFNAMARSHKGAQGLMQIMPRTGHWLADKKQIPRGSLTDPGYNLKLGITYLRHLEELYSGDRVFVLIAYNWGPGHVDSATEGKRRVPSEVVTYAVKIMNDYRKWVSQV